MVKSKRAGLKGWLAPAAWASLATACLLNCTTTSKPGGDSFSTGDATAFVHYDAGVDAAAANAEADGEASTGIVDSYPPEVASCEAGLTFCGGGCTDTKKDPSNCGMCTNPCGSIFQCIGGKCLCPIGGGQAVCNNTCVNTATDQSNCGACGHSCQGSACSNSLCQPTVVAQASGAPISDLAVDSSSVYWTQIALSMNPGAVSFKPFAGSMTTLTITNMIDPSLNDPRGIAVDNENIYWVNVANGAVEAFSLTTQKYTLLRPAITEGGVSDSPYDIASDGQNVYWVTYDGGQVISEPIRGGARTIMAAGENHPRAITFDKTNVYWVDYGDANPAVASGSVMQARKGAISGVTPALVLALNEAQPYDIAVDDTSVYWTNHTNPGQVKKVPIGGGAVVTLASGQGAPYGIAVDTDYVYWTNFDDKNVMRLPKGGDAGAPFALATNQNTPSAITVDAKNVYWADPGALAILKVAK